MKVRKVGLLGYICAFVLAVVLLVGGVISAETSGGNDCNVPSATYSTIQQALTETTCANIYVATGTYTEKLTITRSVAIRGQFPLTETQPIIDGNDSGSVVSINTSEPVTLTDMTIRNGSAVEGGGIYNNGAQLWLIDVAVVNNEASTRGGGIYNQNNGQIHATNLVITGNVAAGDGSPFEKNGGGLSANTGYISMTNVTIANNQSNFGGGVNLFFALAEFDNVTIANNQASPQFGAGGGINVDASTAYFTKTTVVENVAGNGGGVKINNAQATFTSTTVMSNVAGSGAGINIVNGFPVDIAETVVANNVASGDGGGISNVGIRTKIESSSLNGNSSGNRGGGIYNAGYLTLTRSTVSDNAAAGPGTAFAHDFGTLTFLNSTISDNCSLAVVRGGGDHCDNDCEGGCEDEDGHDDDEGEDRQAESGVRFIGTTFVDGRGSGGPLLRVMGAQPTIANSILVGGANLVDGGVISHGFNVFNSADSDILTTTTDLIADPLLAPLQLLQPASALQAIHPLMPNSPAIDSGTCTIGAITLAVDHVGTPRPQGAACDRGSVEVIDNTPAAIDLGLSTARNNTLPPLLVIAALTICMISFMRLRHR